MKYQKRKPFKIEALMGLNKPMIEYFPAFKISKKKAYKTLEERACGI